MDLKASATMVMCFVAWMPPPQGWVKLNIDGSWNSELGSISAGGVIRDERKKWLTGFAMNKGIGTVLEAELWGVFEGLQLAWKAGFRKIVVESDSKCVVHLLSSHTLQNHPLFNIIHACKGLMERDWSCSINHIYRESNKAADFLAKLGLSLDLGVVFFGDPPPHLSSILDDDFQGSAVARMIPSS